MNSIDFETLIVTIFVLVDDWYQQEGKILCCQENEVFWLQISHALNY